LAAPLIRELPEKPAAALASYRQQPAELLGTDGKGVVRPAGEFKIASD